MAEGVTTMMTAFLGAITSALGVAIEWIGTVINVVTGNGVLLALFAVGLAPVAIHWMNLLINSVRN